MVPAFIMLTLAWTISGVCRDLLMTGDFVKDMLAGSALPPALLPAIVVVVAALLSFAMGTAWGKMCIRDSCCVFDQRIVVAKSSRQFFDLIGHIGKRLLQLYNVCLLYTSRCV